MKRKHAETTDSLKKLQAEVKGLEEQKADLQRGGGIGNKEKIFAEKLKKISDELHAVEKRVKDLQARRDQGEIRAEQCKRDAEEIRAKVAAEEARLQKDAGLLKELQEKAKKGEAELKRLQD